MRVVQQEDNKRRCKNQLVQQDDGRAAQQEDKERQCNNQLVQREGKWAVQQEAVQRNERQDGGMTRGDATTSRHKLS
jgi:hypothetical protein